MSEVDLEVAYSKWADELVGYASSLIGPDRAGDLVADVFTQLLHQPEAAWSHVREPRAYLFRCVHNAARMAGRADSRRAAREHAATRLDRASPADAAAGLLADPLIADAVARLSVRQRAVVYHTYWDDLTPAETAALLGVSVGSVKRHLARARAHLRKVLPS